MAKHLILALACLCVLTHEVLGLTNGGRSRFDGSSYRKRVGPYHLDPSHLAPGTTDDGEVDARVCVWHMRAVVGCSYRNFHKHKISLNIFFLSFLPPPAPPHPMKAILKHPEVYARHISRVPLATERLRPLRTDRLCGECKSMQETPHLPHPPVIVQ